MARGGAKDRTPLISWSDVHQVVGSAQVQLRWFQYGDAIRGRKLPVAILKQVTKVDGWIDEWFEGGAVISTRQLGEDLHI